MLPGAVLEEAAASVLAGGVIAYPTEAVYGLGCDPGDESAVLRICQLKQRPRRAGIPCRYAAPRRAWRSTVSA